LSQFVSVGDHGGSMSRLIFTESGRVLLHANEELSRWRWARKVLRVPRARRGAIWMFVRSYPNNKTPLQVILNGRRVATVRAHQPSWQWVAVRAAFRAATNE